MKTMKVKKYANGSSSKQSSHGAMKPVKKLNQGSRNRRPAPVEEPKYDDPLLQALEEERRIAEANEKKVEKKKYGGPVKKMKGGSRCRGMGKASKGGMYTRSA